MWVPRATASAHRGGLRSCTVASFGTAVTWGPQWSEGTLEESPRQGSKMNLLTQAVAGAVSTAAFFLCEGLLGQHFNAVPDGVAKPQPGDLFLFPLASGGPAWCGAHAGIYCGDGEIIHLEGSSGTSPLGIVAKHSKNHLLRTRGPAKVLRRKEGLDVAALQKRIRVAMDQAMEYNAVTCNCVHFALSLLGLGQIASTMVSPALQ
uniref:LRAT domain-containing protein n=1 Tax=Falco tinnunculus TaxID=100819 RepID=A0A8C4V3F9_FALTI